MRSPLSLLARLSLAMNKDPRSWLGPIATEVRHVQKMRIASWVVPESRQGSDTGIGQVHPDPKLLVIFSGGLQVTQKRGWSLLEAGDLLFVPAGRAYGERIPKGITTCMLVIMPQGRNLYLHIADVLSPLQCQTLISGRLIDAKGQLFAGLIETLAASKEEDSLTRDSIDLLFRSLSSISSCELTQAKGGHAAVVQCRKVIENQASDPNMKVKNLAKNLAIHPDALSRQFRHATGSTMRQTISQTRIRRAQHLLNTTTDSIQTIARACGFRDRRSFTRSFRSIAGMNPRAYKRLGHLPTTP